MGQDLELQQIHLTPFKAQLIKNDWVVQLLID